MKPETSISIADWAEQAFGPVASLSILVDRARQEMDELDDAIRSGDSADNILSEAADIAILLHRIAALRGGDLQASIDDKMVINRQRQWQPAGDGTGQHIAPLDPLKKTGNQGQNR